MTHLVADWTKSLTAVVAAIALLPAAQGQTVPRGADGRPDFSGFWQVISAAAWNIQDHHADLDVPAGQGIVEGNEIPYQPWALAQKQENFENRETLDPNRQCYLPGVPRIMYMPFPFQIVQGEGHTAILFEYVHAIRHIFMDGTPHPEGHIPWWMGDSRGHWEDDTLVVDVTHFNDRTWFDQAGNFHSDALHLVERYSFLDGNTINYEVTVEDPEVFTRPWTMSLLFYRRQDENFRLLEYECYAFDDLFQAIE